MNYKKPHVLLLLAGALFLGPVTQEEARAVDPATAAAFATAVAAAADIADLLTVSRSLNLVISNETKYELKNPKFFLDSGTVFAVPPRVKPRTSDIVVAQKTDGPLGGAVGIVTYDIAGTSDKLVAYWSIPRARAFRSNHYAVDIVEAKTACDRRLFNTMASKAVSTETQVSKDWTKNRFTMETGMGDADKATMTIKLKK